MNKKKADWHIFITFHQYHKSCLVLFMLVQFHCTQPVKNVTFPSVGLSDVNISLQHHLKLLYLLSAPCVFYVSMVTVPHWEIKYDRYKLTLKNKNNLPTTNDLSKDCFHFSAGSILNVQSVSLFPSSQLYSTVHSFHFLSFPLARPEHIIFPQVQSFFLIILYANAVLLSLSGVKWLHL